MATTRTKPRAADGKWTTVGDVLGVANGDTVHATDLVKGTGGTNTTIALTEYRDDGSGAGGAVGQFVEVATSPRRYNPATSKEAPPDGEYGPDTIYITPQLAPAEAEQAAAHLDELATLAEAGYRPPKPTKFGRAALRLQHLLDRDSARPGEKIAVGDEDEFPLSARDLLALLRDKDPASVAAGTRRKVVARAMAEGGGDDGTLWLDLEPAADGPPRITVIAVEGTHEDPDSDYWRDYTAHYTPDGARELAAKLRAFARAARRRARR